MNKTQTEIIEMLRLGSANTNQLSANSGVTEKILRNSLAKLVIAGEIRIVVKSRGTSPHVYALGPEARPMKIKREPFIRPVYIGGKRVTNGFEAWLSGLMEAA